MDSNPETASAMGWTPWLVIVSTANGQVTADAINFVMQEAENPAFLCEGRGGTAGAVSGNAYRTAGRKPALLRRNTMNPKLLLSVSALGLLAGLALLLPCRAPAGAMPPISVFTVLQPIRHGNLTVFPVVAARSYDTREFLTLDEGLRSGEVIVTESGSAAPLIRRPPTRVPGPQVDQLVLVNNSKRPLILLAGEIVTGGKQDRVIGKDRIIPAESDPINLGVFCVEPGRWVGSSDRFGVGGTAAGSVTAPMAAPNVRAKAMADKD